MHIYLVDILIVERPRPPQRSTQVRVEIVGAPERPLPALQINVVNAMARVHPALPVHPQRQDEVRRGPEQTPAVIDARLAQQPKALRQPRLDAGQTDLALFRRELVFCRREEARTTRSTVSARG